MDENNINQPQQPQGRPLGDPQADQQQYQQPQYQQQYQQYQQPQYQQPYQTQPEKKLTVNEAAKFHLTGAAKWIKTISIIGLIMCIFLVVVAIFMFSVDYVPGAKVAGLIYLIAAAIYVYPIVKGFAMNTHAKLAIASNNEDELAQSFSNLRSAATYIGVLAIIGLVLLVVAILVAILGADELNRHSHSYWY